MKTLAAILIIAFIVMMVSSCQQYRAVVGEYGSQAADDALEVSRWGHCKAATAASLERKYHLYSYPNGPLAIAWRELCYGSNTKAED